MRSSPVPSPLPVPQPGPCWGSPGLLPSRTPILSTLAPFPGPRGPQRAALSRGCPPPTRLPCPAGLPAPPAFAASHGSWPNIHGYPGEDCSPWRRRLGREDLPAWRGRGRGRLPSRASPSLGCEEGEGENAREHRPSDLLSAFRPLLAFYGGNTSRSHPKLLSASASDRTLVWSSRLSG